MSAIAAVDYAFTVLSATYGAAWDRSLGTSPINDVKTVWADALSDFTHSDEAKRAVMWALKNLPDRCPNAREFRSLCRTAPSKEAVMLPAPTVNPEIAAKVLSGISRTTAKVDNKAWAKSILENPKGRSPTVVQMARNAVAA